MEALELIVNERLELLSNLKKTFAVLYPDPPLKFSPAPIQKELLRVCGVSLSGLNKRAVNEVLSDLGYRKVKIEGYHFFKKTM